MKTKTTNLSFGDFIKKWVLLPTEPTRNLFAACDFYFILLYLRKGNILFIMTHILHTSTPDQLPKFREMIILHNWKLICSVRLAGSGQFKGNAVIIQSWTFYVPNKADKSVCNDMLIIFTLMIFSKILKSIKIRFVVYSWCFCRHSSPLTFIESL